MQQVCINFIRTFSVAALWPLNCSARMELLWLCHFGTILPKASTLLPLKDWVVGWQTGCNQNNLGLMGLFDVTSPARSFTFKCQLEAGLLNPPVLDIVNFGKAPGKAGVVFFVFSLCSHSNLLCSAGHEAGESVWIRVCSPSPGLAAPDLHQPGAVSSGRL